MYFLKILKRVFLLKGHQCCLMFKSHLLHFMVMGRKNMKTEISYYTQQEVKG